MSYPIREREVSRTFRGAPAARVKQAILADTELDITTKSIASLSDVYSSMSPSDGDVLTYDTTNGWQSEVPANGTKSYGHFYLVGLGLTGITSTEVTLTVDTTGETSGDMSLATNQMTINKTGLFNVAANVYLNTSGTSRSEYSMWIEKNGTEVAGTRFASYQRGYDSGMSSGVNTIINITSGDYIQIQCIRTDGGATDGFQDSAGTSVVITEVG